MAFGPAEKKVLAILKNKKRDPPPHELRAAVHNPEINVSAYQDFDFNPNEAGNKDKLPTYSLLFYVVQYHKDNDKAKVIFNLLLDKGADLLWENNTGSNVLMMLAKRNLLEWADRCLEKIPNREDQLRFLNNGSKCNWTALHSSIQNGHDDFSLWLLKNGANPNIKPSNSAWTPLHHAVYMENKMVRDKMLKKTEESQLQTGATHRAFEAQVSVQEMLKIAKEAIKPEELEKKCLKTLVVVTVIGEFRDSGHNRKGAEKDYGLLKKAFENKVDCTVLPVNVFEDSSLSVTKADFKRQIQHVQNKMKDFDLLFWAVSSHGGADANGEFFYDSNLDRIYTYADFIYEFGPNICAAMKNKYSVFFPVCCRKTCEEVVSDAKKPKEEKQEGACLIDRGRFGRIIAATANDPSMRFPAYGSLPIISFSDCLNQEKNVEEKPLRELIFLTAKALRAQMIHYGGGESKYYIQRLGYEDFIMEDIYFKAKK